MSLYILALFVSTAVMETLAWLLVLISIVLVLTQVEARGYLRRLLPITQPLLALSGVVVASYLFNYSDPDLSFRYGVGAFRWIFLLIFLSLIYFYLSREFLYKIFFYISVLALIITAYATYQHFFGWDLVRSKPIEHMSDNTFWRVTGFMSNPMTFAYSFGMFVSAYSAYSIYNWRQTKGFIKKLIPFIFLALYTLTIVFSYTRGAWVALLVSLLTVTYLLSKKLLLALVIFFSLSGFMVYQLSPHIQSRVLSLFDPTDESRMSRIDMWKANIQMWKENPILGVGFNSNSSKLPQYHAKVGVLSDREDHAHNTYIQFLAGLGLLGLLSYLWYQWSVFKRFLFMFTRSKSAEAKALAVGFFGAFVFLLIGGVTECNFKDLEVNHVYTNLVALLLALSTQFSKTGAIDVAK